VGGGGGERGTGTADGIVAVGEGAEGGRLRLLLSKAAPPVNTLIQ
jgi:hypothetical protein